MGFHSVGNSEGEEELEGESAGEVDDVDNVARYGACSSGRLG